MDDGNIKSPLLQLSLAQRQVDENVIDLIEDTLGSSMCESFYDCESGYEMELPSVTKESFI